MIIFFKLYIIGTILFFFIWLLKINSLEKCINSIKESLDLKNEKSFMEINGINKINDNKDYFDKDLIGMTYPEINFNELKGFLINNSLAEKFSNFLNELEIKLIYLEKEINITKLFTFYSIRTTFLKNLKVHYDDKNITELHNIINWEVIHRSTQLKGIASDKYLVCKYAKIKLGENLCEQRIRVYNNVEEINFDELADK